MDADQELPKYCNGQLKRQPLAPIVALYPNGQRVRDELPPFLHFYPNAQVVRDALAPYPLYYPNGRKVRDTLAPFALYYPNGQLVRDVLAPYTVYYPNGQKTFNGVNCLYQDGSILAPCPKAVPITVDAGEGFHMKFKLMLESGFFDDVTIEFTGGKKYSTRIGIRFDERMTALVFEAIEAECL